MFLVNDSQIAEAAPVEFLSKPVLHEKSLFTRTNFSSLKFPVIPVATFLNLKQPRCWAQLSAYHKVLLICVQLKNIKRKKSKRWPDSQQLDFGPVWVTWGVTKAWGAKIPIACIPDIEEINLIYAKNRKTCSKAGKAPRPTECSASAPGYSYSTPSVSSALGWTDFALSFLLILFTGRTREFLVCYHYL